MRVGAEAHRHAGRAECGAGADAVGEITLGRRAQAACRAGASERGDIGIGHVGRVHRGETIAERAVSVEQLDRCAAMDGSALLVLRRLLATWAWSGALRSAAHVPTTAIDAGSTARTEWIAAPIRTVADDANPSTLDAHESASPSENRRCTPSGAIPNPPWR